MIQEKISVEKQKEVYNNIIDGVINAKDSSNLKVLIDIVKSYRWE